MSRAITLVLTLSLFGSAAHAADGESILRLTLDSPEFDLDRSASPVGEPSLGRPDGELPTLGATPTLAVASRAGSPMHTWLVLSLASLQALDVALTLRAISRGATEANPVMSGVVGSPAAFVALKAATTAASIYGVQKIRKRHPGTTTAFVLAINAAMFAVVAHNAGLK